MDKKTLTEEDIKLRFITPSITNAGWKNDLIRMEYTQILDFRNVTVKFKDPAFDGDPEPLVTRPKPYPQLDTPPEVVHEPPVEYKKAEKYLVNGEEICISTEIRYRN